MIGVNLAGGLGNYLFQISAAYSFALDNNDTLIIDESKIVTVHKHMSTYKTNIFRNLNYGLVFYENYYPEPFFHYKEIPAIKNLFINGYFQSEKYFKNNRNKILDLFSIDENSLRYINEKYKDIDFLNSTSLHIRRGDYKNLPLHHPICEMSYYHKAIDIIKPENLLIFSDDINWCKESFKDYKNNIIYIDNNPDYIELWLMSMCKNNIIANSTFSWWGAWLNNNNKKIVVAPSRWFGSAIKHEIKDLLLEEWIKI